jgi:hypothetical protein
MAGERPAAEKETTMRTRTGIVLGLLLAVAVAGCGRPSKTPGVATARSGAAASGSATPTLNERDMALRYSQCMRENGVPNFPDPKIDDNGNMSLDAPGGADPVKMDAAMQKCKQYLPNGGQPRKADPQVLEQLRRFAQCMRDNGVPKFPDPTDEGLSIDPGKLGITGRPEDDPKYAAAQRKCAQYMPVPPSGGAPATNNVGGN